jgi:hypothetical protein
VPAITELAADEASGPLAAALGGEEYTSWRKDIHAAAALTPTAIAADIEPAPVINDGGRRRRGVRTPNISGRSRGSHA